MHKFSCSDTFLKLRPIVSSIGTFNYDLARFLCDLLSPVVPNDYSCKDTFSFVSQIKNANLSCKFLVSYDITSLFITNIPLQETIDAAINLIFNHNPNLNIPKKELKKLFLFATLQTYFVFNGTLYNQIDGVAMGSPLAPVLANIFMGFYESLFLIDKVIKTYLDHKFSSNQNQLKDISDVYYFKLPYIGNLFHHIKNKLSKLCKEFCEESFSIKLVFNSFKTKS